MPTSVNSKRERLLNLGIRVLLPLSLAGVLVAVMMGEKARIDVELQLFMQREVKPGEDIAIRGLLLTHLHDAEGPRLETARADLVLRTQGGRVEARTRLVPTAAMSLEGSLHIPSNLSGRYYVEANAVAQGETARTFAALDITPRARPLTTRGRSAFFTQQESVAAMQRQPGETPPRVLEPRILGGACIPAAQCDVLVRVGEPASAVELVPSEAIRPLPLADEARQETSSIVPVSFTLDGPEGETDLRATRGGRLVGVRRFQVPVALGEPSLSIPESVVESPARPMLTIRNVETSRAIIVDGFRDGMWERTGVVSEEAAKQGPVAIPFAPLTPGTWRIQVRTDPFTADSAATRMLRVVERGTPPEAALRSAISLDVTPSQPPPGTDLRALKLHAAYALAAQERDRMNLPEPWSGQRESAEQIARAKWRVRVFGTIGLALIAIVVSLIVARRGLRSASEARALMAEAGDPGASDPKVRRRQTLTLLLMVALIVLFFVTTITFVIARTSF
ncbi:MAG: hypothetical protein IPK60_17915 [Sandaracinaceae bacterium]|nr:hypothetical protein [Sandaracinaceae bacterium]